MLVSWLVAFVSSTALLFRAGSARVEFARLGLLFIGGIVWVVAAITVEERRTLRPVRERDAPPGTDPGVLRRWFMGALALLGLLLSAALTGHARTSSLPLPNLVVALVHVTGAAIWIGGLVVLMLVAFPAVREQEEGVSARLMAPVVARFSDLALWSVCAIIASGAYSAWVEIRELRAVTSSTYGLVFLVKLGAFLPAFALGGVNRLWTKPRLLKTARGEIAGSSPLLILRRLVALEIALIAVVVGLTAFLVHLPPPTNPATGP
jgi:putative copper export protein